MEKGWGCPVDMWDSLNWSCKCSIMEQQGPRAKEQAREPAMHSCSWHAVHVNMHRIECPGCNTEAKLAALTAVSLHPNRLSSVKGLEQLLTNLITKCTQVQRSHGWRHKAELNAVNWAGRCQQSFQLWRSRDQRPTRLRNRHGTRSSRASRSSMQLLLLL